MSFVQTSTAGRSPPIFTPHESSSVSTPAALPLLPALKRKTAAAAAKSRYGRVGKNYGNVKISSRHPGGTTLLVDVEGSKSHNDGTNTVVSTNTVNLCDFDETRMFSSVKSSGEPRGLKDTTPAALSQTITPAGRGTTAAFLASSSRAHSLAPLMSAEGGRKSTINVSASEFSQGTDISKRTDHPHRHRRLPMSTEFDPTAYTSLLPATVRLQKVGEPTRKSVSVGTTAKELLAERGIMRSDRNVLLNGTKRVQGVPMLELRQFETQMKLLKDRGRNIRRRWKQQATNGGNSGNNNNIRIVNENDESSSESGESSDSSSNSISTESREQQQLQQKKESVAAAAARRERIKVLQLSGDSARDRILLRNELKKSRAEVEKARNGITTEAILFQKQENLIQDKDDKEDDSDSKSIHVHMEDVSWGAEHIVLPNKATPPSHPHETHSNPETKNSRNSTTQSDRRLSTVFHDLLHRARGTMVYGLYPADMQRERRRRRRERQRRRQSSAPLRISPSPSPSPVNNSERATPFNSQPRSSQPKTEKQLRHGSEEGSRRRHRPLPVEYGVGERSRQLYDAQIQEQRIEDLQTELEHGEDILHTRELLAELLPERIKLLDESFRQTHEHASVVLQKHRDKLFKMASTIQAEERQQACLALVDLLEESYRGEIGETAWPSVLKALHKTRELITISPNRCNARNFHSIVKEYFLMSHLLESGVDDMLRRLSQLFDMTKSQYKYVMTNIYQRLNQPRNYQSRFREIERTILGKGEISEKRYRIILHRCRFLLPLTNMGPVVPTTTGPASTTGTNTTIMTNAITAGAASATTVPSDFSASITGMNASATVAAGGVGTNDVQGGVVVSTGELLRRERGGERFKISVHLKSDHQTFISRAVSTHVKESAGMTPTTERQSNHESIPYYTANLRRQAFRLQLYENSLLEVMVQRNGLTIASGELKLMDCTFDPRGTSLLWLRLTGGTCLQAEIKLGLEILYEKDRGRRMTRNDLYK